MKVRRYTTRLLAFLLIPLLSFGLVAFPAAAATETLTVYCDGENVNRTLLMAVAHAFEKANPNIHIRVNIGPTGVEAVELVKSRLAAGTMDDVFLSQSGSLFQALDPTINLTELTNETWRSSVLSSYFPTVSIGDKLYGAPFGSAMGGGILYNKAVYKKLGLKIPLTWAQFMRNNAIIKKAGLIPVIQTYKDSWTSQLFVLADYFNVQKVFPGFADLYTSHRAKIADTPVALVGFQHLEEIYKAKYLNKDFATATLARGLKYLATGAGAHYPMLTFVASTLVKDYPKQAENIGFFAQPGASAQENGLTVWMPNGLFIPKSTKHLSAAKKFVAYSVSPAALAIMNVALTPTGPYLIKGARLSGRLSTVAHDMLPYFKSNGRTAPALEFVSPIKGPNLSKITVQVGSGKISAKVGAKAYDRDVEKESARLGLPGWGKLPR
ncbi:MAG: ABC transporter substrate-binding protein [Candidatus Nanopelagicaceae bacterium]|nr:ABC transporter substrate-binding protein [Candidatus Nanopelagicaceae bacterium]